MASSRFHLHRYSDVEHKDEDRLCTLHSQWLVAHDSPRLALEWRYRLSILELVVQEESAGCLALSFSPIARGRGDERSFTLSKGFSLVARTSIVLVSRQLQFV